MTFIYSATFVKVTGARFGEKFDRNQGFGSRLSPCLDLGIKLTKSHEKFVMRLYLMLQTRLFMTLYVRRVLYSSLTGAMMV